MKKPLNIQLLLCIVILVWTYIAAQHTAYAAILRPSGGETGEFWHRGTTQMIQWDTSRFHGTLTISIWNQDVGSYFTIVTSATATAGEYAWNIPAMHAIGTNFRIKVQENNAPYHCEMSDTFFAISDAPQSIATTVGREKGRARARMTIYPNPTEGLFTIQGETSEDVPIQCTLTTVLGATVLSFEEHADKGAYNRTVNIEHLPAGTYLLTIQAGDTQSSVKLVKR